jgi:nitroreductase
MKKFTVLLVFIALAGICRAQERKPLELLKPDKTRGLPVMQALDQRASVRDWSSKPLSLQDLSDVLWAANGVNRDDGRRTAASAMNAQDVDVYVLMQDGAWLYNAAKHILEPVAAGDFRELAGKTDAPVTLVLVSDISRFKRGEDSLKLSWAALDAGIVSQNIALCCSGLGLKTRPRASFPGMDKLRAALKLSSTQVIFLNHPVGYNKD